VSSDFFERPILNSPYEYPAQHWILDPEGQPTNNILESRRKSAFVTPVPKPRKRRRGRDKKQAELVFKEEETAAISTAKQQYDTNTIINEIRQYVHQWRALPNPQQWQVTPETGRLLQHWRSYPFANARPFFCQTEAIETAIWLTEVAPHQGERGKKFLDYLSASNAQANPELFRIALKLATGAGKTTVIAMLIAWQTINSVRYPSSKIFTRGFVVVTPGITIRDRLRVILPSDTDNYYKQRELIPGDMLTDIGRAKIVITNYHAFKLRERIDISKVGRALLKGRGPELQTTETEGQMLQRVMPDLMGMQSVLVINDEAHHCYRHKVSSNGATAEDNDEEVEPDEAEEAKKNTEAARLWISGIEIIKRKLGVRTVFDLSATPFFLRGSGYAEGTLFPWTVCDFSLMDAIECGIVKLPRVPVADNVPGEDMPIYRNLWEHIGKKMPKKGRGKAGGLDPHNLPVELQTALDALYGHYRKIYDLWQEENIGVPPVFIIVCNNTSTSKLVHDYVSGFYRLADDGKTNVYQAGRIELFRNYDEAGNRLARPRTLLIDSEQLESGEALDPEFRAMAADEIERFRREMIERGDAEKARKITDQDLLREVMNTVGKEGKLGESIRCVVSVAMLTEGWDANTVTHILGVRAFGTQLLCEQVVGRGLRRQSYDLDKNNRLSVEYADILGIPFDFTAKPVVVKPKPPRPTVRVCAVRPDRDALEIKFPRVEGYRVELPEEKLSATFNKDSTLELNPKLVGPSKVLVEGIVGKAITLDLGHLKEIRPATIVFHLTKHLLLTKYRDPGKQPKLHLFGQLKSIVRQWLESGYLRCTGGTFQAQVLYREIADIACERIKQAITETLKGEQRIKVILDPYNPEGSTSYVDFPTSKRTRWKTDPRKCHINWVVCDSDWEAEFCRVAEAHPRVRAYVKNQGLGLEVPYLMASTPRKYLPDFIVQIDDGHDDPLSLIVEIKGFRGEDAKEKANTMRAYWIPGVNNLETYGRWQFAEFTSVFDIDDEFNKLIDSFAESVPA
jgi:type III restriction enzyme